MNIKFGTSGWRGLIAKDFTFPNVRICTRAIAEEIIRQKEHNKPVVVGYDTRFLSEHFAREAAEVCARNGMEVRFSDRDAPTPVVSHEVIKSQEIGVDAYKLLDESAEVIPPGSDCLLFLPHLMLGERAPYWDEHLRGGLLAKNVIAGTEK